jgi:hypothetical protein
MRFGAYIVCFLLLFPTSTVFAQNVLERAYELLQKGTELPENLRSGRSMVLVRSELSQSLTSGAGLEMLTTQFHQRLMEMNIDVVAYYRWQDLVAGFDATNSYLKNIKDREAAQLLILHAKPGDFNLHIVPTSEDRLFDPESPGWHSTNTTLEGLVENLASAVRRSDLEIANFLIAETPEFFIDTRIFTKNRFESFQPDLKLDKLAVPLFHSDNPDSLGNVEDRELRSLIVSQYPFSFELVGNQMKEELMKKAGFQYVLRYLHAEESTLLTLLDYNDESNEPTRKSYKFYVKHLISGDIYLGDGWDSRTNWQSALTSHISNMRRSLKVE